MTKVFLGGAVVQSARVCHREARDEAIPEALLCTPMENGREIASPPRAAARDDTLEELGNSPSPLGARIM
jgi:hypothetical protein